MFLFKPKKIVLLSLAAIGTSAAMSKPAIEDARPGSQ